MIESGLIPIALAVVLGSAVWYLPSIFEERAKRLAELSVTADEFYSSLHVLERDSRVPQELRAFLLFLNSEFGSPRLVRKIVLSALRGELTKHSIKQSQLVRLIIKSIEGLPTEVRNQLLRAVACTLLASALTSRVAGFIFLRFMLIDPERKTEAERFVPRIALATEECRAAA